MALETSMEIAENEMTQVHCVLGRRIVLAPCFPSHKSQQIKFLMIGTFILFIVCARDHRSASRHRLALPASRFLPAMRLDHHP